MATHTTPLFLLPYPDGDELVINGDAAFQALAMGVEAAMNPAWTTITSLGTNYSARSGYFVPACRVFGDGRVQLRGGLTKSVAIVSTETIFTLPVAAWPSSTVSLVIAVHRSSGTTNSVAGKLDIATNGVTTIHVIDAQAPVSVAVDGASFSR